MKKNRKSKSAGFTIVELMIAVAITMIASFAVAVVLANSTRAYQVTYDKANADVVTDAVVARRLFDVTVRKASASNITIGQDGQYAQLQYYNNDESTYLDRYTRFYISDTELLAEYGSLNESAEQTIIETTTVCSNVVSCVFRNNGSSVTMILTLDNGDETNVVTTSAYANN